MVNDDLRWRSKLARQLTARGKASARATLTLPITFGGRMRRIGVSGAPGAGKSSVIAMLAQHWTTSERKVGVLAIDPTSPVSGGALLGDRIRMDKIAQSPNLFIRSMSSGSVHDGLCPNISALISAFEEADFDDLILETVGVGQTSYQARSLVDTFVLVIVPESGDTIQAMKGGILELADVYLVNKADRPEASKVASEMRSVAAWRARHGGWIPPVILASAIENRGGSLLAEAIDTHRRSVLTPDRVLELAIARRECHLRSLMFQNINEVLLDSATELRDLPITDSLRLLMHRLERSLEG